MIGLDTNVLVRYLTQDDPAQARKATQAIESGVAKGEEFFIADIVVCELVWVLEDAYGYTRTDIADAIDKVLRVSRFNFQNKTVLWAAFEDYQRGRGDLSDHLVGQISQQSGCEYTLTFDTGLKSNRLFRML